MMFKRWRHLLWLAASVYFLARIVLSLADGNAAASSMDGMFYYHAIAGLVHLLGFLAAAAGTYMSWPTAEVKQEYTLWRARRHAQRVDRRRRSTAPDTHR